MCLCINCTIDNHTVACYSVCRLVYLEVSGGDDVFSLNYKSGEPIYEQLYHSVTKLAALGGFNREEQLPSVRALAQEMGVNPATVQKAYQLLERDGIICSVPGKGSFLANDSAALARQQENAKKHLVSAVDEARNSGLAAEEILVAVKAALGGEKND